MTGHAIRADRDADGIVARCWELAGRYGSRFTPPPSLVALAERGEPFRPRRRT